MCGGWACASYHLACNNPPLSTVRFTGRDFIPTPCGPCDPCHVKDTSFSRGGCSVPMKPIVETFPCPDISGAPKPEAVAPIKAEAPTKAEGASKLQEQWQQAYQKVKSGNLPANDNKNNYLHIYVEIQR
ncbi:uncharacterized protein LOC108602048 [Drosophila busckii]|nr:uncharacterized protein LOC108602048 [Drosophila busckii]